MTVDDRYLDGIYFDAGTGEFYEIDRDDETDEAILLDLDGDEVERIDGEEWDELQIDFYEVPEEAVNNPVRYYKEYVNMRRQNHDFDAGFLYADESTEVTLRES